MHCEAKLFDVSTREDENVRAQHPENLTDCVVPLNSEDIGALHCYWDQVIREEWVPPAQRELAPAALVVKEERRAHREARRSMARIVRPGRRSNVVALPTRSTPHAGSSVGGEAA